jgi:hypothetical protein
MGFYINSVRCIISGCCAKVIFPTLAGKKPGSWDISIGLVLRYRNLDDCISSSSKGGWIFQWAKWMSLPTNERKN